MKTFYEWLKANKVKFGLAVGSVIGAIILVLEIFI